MEYKFEFKKNLDLFVNLPFLRHLTDVNNDICDSF